VRLSLSSHQRGRFSTTGAFALAVLAVVVWYVLLLLVAPELLPLRLMRWSGVLRPLAGVLVPAALAGTVQFGLTRRSPDATWLRLVKAIAAAVIAPILAVSLLLMNWET